MPAKTTYTDVLIVGAGPAGLMSAVCLSRLGISFKIIDRRLPGEAAGHADGIQPRTTEIWDTLGMGDRLRKIGVKMCQMAMYTANEDNTGVRLTGQTPNSNVPGTKYPYEIILRTEDIEGIMTDTIATYGVRVQQPTVPRKLVVLDNLNSTDGYRVEITCVNLNADRVREGQVPLRERGSVAEDPSYINNVEVFRAKYVIGCDGAHSWVRGQCGIAMDSSDAGVSWGVIDFTPVTNLPTPRAKNIIQSPLSGILATIPRPDDTMRIYAAWKENTAVTNEMQLAAMMESKLPEFIKRAFLPYQFEVKDITWCGQYTVAQRVASSFSYADCVFIAGDACHTHSPNAGLGANASMSDAYNLAWKLAYVLHGWSNLDMLGTYEAERRPCSVELIELDKKIHELDALDGAYPEEYVRLLQRQRMFATGIGLEYRSRLTENTFQSLIPGLLLGQRIPPGDILRYHDWNPCDLQDLLPYSLSFKLILFPGDVIENIPRHRLLDFLSVLEGTLTAHIGKELEVAAILNVKKAAFQTLPQLSEILPSTRIYLDDRLISTTPEHQGRLHESLGIRRDFAAAVLVRPDGYTAMILPMDRDGVRRIRNYVRSLSSRDAIVLQTPSGLAARL
ncbi:uncharacterized protein LAESUDRAFT_147053 [Laetiporus sulphureus 93-53]|uniref:FAD-binding domain-containing protein n=1 Tax=Laetiporus sulphureus 93-53 TaxID=1314785 RepID=A0A165EBF7_9APHY|nr:uncharacterized protein LAESUDRAFT_147053 [Laetiporus sulphureus 93-53]KZT06658.1 hypothetical protein LAESUDRAFT_147053 [Laetiporus sulphureus 93-53]